MNLLIRAIPLLILGFCTSSLRAQELPLSAKTSSDFLNFDDLKLVPISPVRYKKPEFTGEYITQPDLPNSYASYEFAPALPLFKNFCFFSDQLNRNTDQINASLYFAFMRPNTQILNRNSLLISYSRFVSALNKITDIETVSLIARMSNISTFNDPFSTHNENLYTSIYEQSIDNKFALALRYYEDIFNANNLFSSVFYQTTADLVLKKKFSSYDILSAVKKPMTFNEKIKIGLLNPSPADIALAVPAKKFLSEKQVNNPSYNPPRKKVSIPPYYNCEKFDEPFNELLEIKEKVAPLISKAMHTYDTFDSAYKSVTYLLKNLVENMRENPADYVDLSLALKSYGFTTYQDLSVDHLISVRNLENFPAAIEVIRSLQELKELFIKHPHLSYSEELNSTVNAIFLLLLNFSDYNEHPMQWLNSLRTITDHLELTYEKQSQKIQENRPKAKRLLTTYQSDIKGLIERLVKEREHFAPKPVEVSPPLELSTLSTCILRRKIKPSKNPLKKTKRKWQQLYLVL